MLPFRETGTKGMWDLLVLFLTIACESTIISKEKVLLKGDSEVQMKVCHLLKLILKTDPNY